LVWAVIYFFPRGFYYLARWRANGDAELELWAAHRHVAPLEALLGKPIRFEVASQDLRQRTDGNQPLTPPSTNAEQPDDATRVSGKAVRSRRHRRVGKNDPTKPVGEMA
jgi:hypothetical protein